MSRPVMDAAPPDQDSGVEQNARLTSLTGMVLLIGLAVEGYTILSVHQLITLHIALGVLLVGPVLLKCVTTMHRFVQYYRGHEPYVRKGPPHTLLRVLGPVVIVTSLAVLGTGIALIYLPGSRDTLLFLHKASFVVWFAAMVVHVLGHVVEAFRVSAAELTRTGPPLVTARRGRRLLVVLASLVVGLGLMLAVLPSAHQWTSGHGYRDGGSPVGTLHR